MLFVLDYNHTVLLDPAVMIAMAENTLDAFFQHYASARGSATRDGGWAFRRGKASLPGNRGPILENENPQLQTFKTPPTMSTGLTPAHI